MSFCTLLALAGAAAGGRFSEPLEILQPVRLELTPTLDGTISREEWDPFVGQTFLQWEPAKMHFAGQLEPGKDLVLTIDRKADGWLVGNDNYEARVTMRDNKPVLVIRQLDATAVKEPTWIERKDLEQVSAVAANGQTVEATFCDAGLGILPKEPAKMMLRVDAIDSSPEMPAYTPRVCSQVSLGTERATALPSSLGWGVQARSRAVIPGESVHLHLKFESKDSTQPKAVRLRSEGPVEDSANSMSFVLNPTPKSGVDYTSNIDSAAPLGYHLVRGTVNFNAGPDGMVQASYRIAPLLDFSLQRTYLEQLPENNTFDLPYVLQLYTRQAADGFVHVDLPQAWEATRGQDAKFRLLGNQSNQLMKLQVKAPNDAHGTFPLVFTGKVGEKSVSQTCYITIR